MVCIATPGIYAAKETLQGKADVSWDLQGHPFAALIHACQDSNQVDHGIMLHNLNIRHIELDMTDT